MKRMCLFISLSSADWKKMHIKIQGRLITGIDFDEEIIDLQSNPTLEEIYSSHLIFAHPEAVFNTQEGRQLLDCDRFKSGVKAIVIDECHKVHNWHYMVLIVSLEGQILAIFIKRGKSFRTAFKHIRDIPAFLPDAARLGLSATVSLQEEKDMVKDLGIKTPCIVKESPDKTNIYLEKTLKGSSNDVYEMFENINKPLCDDLFVKKENFSVTLVYIRIQNMGSAIAYCRFIFRDSNLHNCFYGALCSGQDENVKATILTYLGKNAPRIRLMFCKYVIGMGFNSSSIDCIIHTKPPRNMSDFVQEIGRAGRDGRPARSTLFCCKRDISSNVPEIKNDIVQYCNHDTYLRSCMLGQFGFKKGDMIDHECCIYCRKSCRCIECELLRIEL